MIDILMIALEFAPVQTTGAARSIAFAKHLQALGIRPTVVTIDPEQSVAVLGGQLNPGLSESLPGTVSVRYIREAKTRVKETPLGRLWRLMTNLDDTFQRRFEPDLLRVLKDLQAERPFAAVYASAPPFGASLMGASAARTLGLPYILDMRDAWAEWAPGPSTTHLHRLRRQRDEARAFGAADAVVGVTPELVKLFADSHPGLPGDRFHVVTNGVSGVDTLPGTVIWKTGGDTVDIGYVGNFYYKPAKPATLTAPHRFLQHDPGTEDWSYRSPKYFFRAWAALDRRAPALGQRMRFHLVGNVPDWLPGMAKVHGVDDRCVFHGRKPKQDIPAFLGNMTATLGTSMKRIGGLDYCIASKSFEYLASGKPTLAFVCDGAQKRFFETVGGAVIIDPDDPDTAATRLAELIETRELSLPLSKPALLDYDHSRTTARMAAVIRRTVDAANKGGAADAA